MRGRGKNEYVDYVVVEVELVEVKKWCGGD